jgi:DNA-binding response OmpR family regulator
MRILIVEDAPIMAQLIETIIKPQKYAMDFAIDLPHISENLGVGEIYAVNHH